MYLFLFLIFFPLVAALVLALVKSDGARDAVVLGAGVTVSALLELLFAWQFAELLVLPALIIGFAMILYAQFKYNGGIF